MKDCIDKTMVIKAKYENMKSDLEEAMKTIYKLEIELTTLKSTIKMKENATNVDQYNNGKVTELEQENLNLKKANHQLSNELSMQVEQNSVLKRTIKTLHNKYNNDVAENRLFQMKNVHNDVMTIKCPQPINNIILRLHTKIEQMVDCIMELLMKEKLEYSLNCYKDISALVTEVNRSFNLSDHTITNTERKY